MPGCSEQGSLLGDDQLRELYPAVLLQSQCGGVVDISSTDLDSILYYADLICIVAPASEPAYSTTKTGYKTMRFQIVRTLFGKADGTTITVESITSDSTYMDYVNSDFQYIMCLYSEDTVWYTMTQGVLYVSKTNQIVPFTDWNTQAEVLGMTINEFDKRIDTAKKADPRSFKALQ